MTVTDISGAAGDAAGDGAVAPAGARVWTAVVAGFAAYAALLALGWWLLLHMLPDRLPLHFGRRAVVLERLHARLINNAGVLPAVLPFTLAVECAVVGWARSSLRRLLVARSPSIKADLAVLVLGQARVLDVVGRVLMLGASFISGVWIHDWLLARGLAPDFAVLPWALQFAACFMLFSLCDYWTHRIDHTHVFWPLHRFHHSAEEFAVITSARVHPVELVNVFVINLPIAALGAPADVLVWVNVVGAVHGFLIHSEIPSDWGWFGRWVLQSPLHHRLHHKLSMETPTGHFGTMPLWDRLFGSWTGGERPDLPIGVSTPYRHGFWIGPDLLRDYWDFWRGVFGRRAPD